MKRRDRYLKLRVNATELAEITRAASTRRLSVSAFLRTTALRLPLPVPRVDRQALVELNRLGVNVNQLARAANTARDHGQFPHVDVATELAAVKALLERLLAELAVAEDGAGDEHPAGDRHAAA